MTHRPLARSSVSVLTMLALAVALALAALPTAPAAAHGGRLTNLAHLDFLGDRVTPPAQPGHDTYRLAAEERVDGVFLTDLRVRDPRFALLVQLGLPAVAVGRPTGACPVPAVMVDDRTGVAEAVAHLLALGHTRIAYVGGTDGYVHAASRREAWRGALEAAGVAPGPELVGDFTGPGGAAATRALLALPDRPTAVVYANDLMAVAGMSVALSQGLKLPADLSVVGFDDVPLAAHVTPALTTVRQDAEAWGRAAAQALLALAGGEAVEDLSLAPSQLVVRSSSSPPGHPRP